MATGAVRSDDPLPALAFVAAPDVFTARVDGLLIALDLRSDAYYVFDEVATSMWEALLDCGDRASALARVCAAYGEADRGRVERDLDAFATRVVEGGFARWAAERRDGPHAAPGGAPRARVRNASSARAWWWLARTVLRLRRDGAASAYRRCIALTGVALAPAHDRAALLERALRAFGQAENFFALRKAPRDCLPRSIALFSFLRELGLPAEHRIGVDRYPFRAHAWVETDGRVLADHSGNAVVFTTIARIAG